MADRAPEFNDAVIPGNERPSIAMRPRADRARVALTIAAALAGGTIASTCETRIRDAIVAGTKDYLFTDLLNPSTFIESISTDGEGTVNPP